MRIRRRETEKEALWVLMIWIFWCIYSEGKKEKWDREEQQVLKK